ncbi:MAG: hypothetical protein PHF30_03995 [Bacilli bacterium]|nr:hypothetical protein [Bacilli bacterium]
MKEELNLLKEVRKIIDELGGIDEQLLFSIGINVSECLNPTEETLRLLKNYQAKANEDIERLDFNL